MLSRNGTQLENTILKISFVVGLLFPISYKNWKTRIASLFSWDVYPHLLDVSFEPENASCHRSVVYNESELPVCCADNFMGRDRRGEEEEIDDII